VDFLCNGAVVFQNVLPHQKTNYSNCLNGNQGLTSIDVLRAGTTDRVTALCISADTSAFMELILEGNKTVDTTVKNERVAYSCSFSNNASSNFVQVTPPSSPVCVVPSMIGLHAGDLISLVGLVLQVEGVQIGRVEGPNVLPTFVLQPYWLSASLPTEASFSVGEHVLVSGSFIRNSSYSCTFLAHNESFHSPFSVPQGNTLQCQITDLFGKLSRGAEVDLVSISEHVSENVTRNVLYAGTSAFPQFSYQPPMTPSPSPNNHVPITIIVATVLTGVLLLMMIAIFLGVMRYLKRKHHNYIALPN